MHERLEPDYAAAATNICTKFWTGCVFRRRRCSTTDSEQVG